jgi:outer membrane murein-binding lipoprotein Lpp
MEFPVTIDSQEDFDKLIKPRLDREKTKHADLETQVNTLTAEKQELETKVTGLETRATTAEQWKTDRETEDQITDWAKKIAKDEKLPDGAWQALKGSTEDELKAHAETLKPLLSKPTTSLARSLGETPEESSRIDVEAREAVQQLFGGGE